MQILIFSAGFLFGIVSMLLYFKMLDKHKKQSNEILLEQMRMYFENTANKLFKENTHELTEQNKEKLETFYLRFKEKIDEFAKRTEENFRIEKDNFTKFDTNIQTFLSAGNKISQDTNALVNAMKSDNRKQGAWGEIVLEKVLEASGLRKDEEYKIQKGTAEGRPDAAVFLPDNRCVYIDSKTSFAAWDGYINAQDEVERSEYLKQFIDSTKAHISGLAKRDYAQDEKSPDFVLMFIPIEGCYSLMFCDDCALWNLAWKNGIMPVSPSTLLAALKIINSFHIVERQNKNAREIADLAGRMTDKCIDLFNELLKIRENLDTSIKKLNGKDNILRQIERMGCLGVKMNKQLPNREEVDSDYAIT